MLKEILGIVAVALAFACYIPYYVGIFRGRIRPHLETYLVWSIIGVLAFVASFVSGGGFGSWSLAASALLTIGVFILCFKYGTTDVTRSDTFFTIGAFLAIALWLLTKDPTLSVILATLIEVLAFFPTIRKTWSDPGSESLSSWGINTVKHTVVLFALGSFSIATVFYPAVMVFMNGLLVVEILSRSARQHREI